MPAKIGKDFLFSKKCGFINGEDGDSYTYSDGSGYYHGDDGSEGYIYSFGDGYYHGADGSDGYIYSDGSAYYRGADGTDAYKYSDGSGYYNGADGSEGRRYSDGSGYYVDADGNRYSFDSDNNESCSSDTESSGNSGYSFSGSSNTIVYEVLEALINKHEQKEFIKPKWVERVEKFNAWERKIRRFIFSVIFTALVLFFGYYEYTIRIPIGYSSTSFLGNNYDVVVNELKEAGFKFVTSKNIADLSIDNLTEEYSVTKVKVLFITDFKENWEIPSNTPITVIYHTLQEVGVPFSSKEIKEMKLDDIVFKLREVGFSTITTEAEYDLITGWLADEGSVKSVTINGDKKFSEGDTYRIDSEIVIVYHDYSKNKGN